jgi:hypothetical protein
MREALNELTAELKSTRESFDDAIKSVRWNKINTSIQYGLIAIVVVFGFLGFRFYQDDRHDACVATNEFRQTIVAAQEKYALNFATALAKKLNGDSEDVREFMLIYSSLPTPEVLVQKEC